MLWNPYNIAIETTEYQLQIESRTNWDLSFYHIESGQNINGEDLGDAADGHFYESSRGAVSRTQSPVKNRPLRFTFTTAFKPGQAIIVTPNSTMPLAAPATDAPTSAQTNLLSPGLQRDTYLYQDVPYTFELPADKAPYNIYPLSDTNGGRLSITLGMNGYTDSGNDHSISSVLQRQGMFQTTYPLGNDSSSPQYQASDFLTPGTEILPPSVLLSDLFPSNYMYNHLRLSDNFMAIDTNSAEQKMPTNLLAHQNPRAFHSTAHPAGWNGGGPSDNQLFLQSRSSVSSHNIRNFLDEIEADSTGAIPMADKDSRYTNSNKTFSLFDLPRAKNYFSSVGSLTHANLSTTGTSQRKWVDIKKWSTSDYNSELRSTHQTSTHPSYSIGNSLADPYIPVDSLYRKGWVNRNGVMEAPELVHSDWSYLLNDVLWDSYLFTGYNEDSGVSEALNPRIRPRSDWNSSTPPTALNNYSQSASEFIVNGAFNINSTSIESWKAFLSGLRGIDFIYNNNQSFNDGTHAAYSRMATPSGTTVNNTTDYTDQSYYNGFRILSDTEIQDLAEALVKEVKKRGPFRSLAHFVNRSVDSDEYSSTEELNYGIAAKASSTPEISPHYKGAIAAAIAQTNINKEHFGADQGKMTLDSSDDYQGAGVLNSVDPVSVYGESTAHYPGDLAQSDVLMQIGDAITARSDRFKIRAYGDTINPVTEESATAICEMVVQRRIEYVDSADAAYIAPDALTSAANKRFGRKYEIVSIKWIGQDEL
ncbi:hypothetical protein SH580_19120 [Coraliomargarita algicola]|uniref:Uncharacterized protein n=1 Tax=Coraliomargarita algicola TaxID=3092156 RepID=A0ABZ0RJ26_9BACT|nr:hypothetical protein [Coraliomargarita sp. J2-16]WPJ95532.1 hypothetical protein SH580_19120 [Coraliomargarita sp. J2-16]